MSGAINVFLSQMVQPNWNPNGEGHHSEGEKDTSFLKILDGLYSNNADTQSKLAPIQTENSGGEELQEKLQELLLENELYHLWNEDLESNEIYTTFLKYVEELTGLLDRGEDLEEFVTSIGSKEDPLHLLALISAFTVMEENDSSKFDLTEISQMITVLEPLVQQTFFINVVEGDRTMFRPLMEQVIHYLKEPIPVEGNRQTVSQLDQLQNMFNRKSSLNNLLGGLEKSRQKSTEKPIFFSMDHSNSHMSKVQQLFLHSGNRGDKVSEQQIFRQFQQALDRSQFQQLSNGIKQLSIKLHPQSLGRLDITIQQVNGVIVAKMMTTTTVARELLEGQMNQLRQAFQTQQLQVDRIEVTQQQTQQNTLRDQQGEQRGQQQQSQKPPHEQQTEKEEDDAFFDFLQETINLEV
ncbi:flagellar hook-length control protein FliK [Evansella tamaricis]|uniref:Flagellar hook-length control protein FliK n=1 Tax=Evansella tamaricis TaxID=2069301 RepID=A0ABS6JLK8_9BACI|nr:flagellar hook-length control protein FliK [Evansella tamaricis]MBU9714550.1 flagellar hook-length control protein FliK [Evansella tamaricis]